MDGFLVGIGYLTDLVISAMLTVRAVKQNKGLVILAIPAMLSILPGVFAFVPNDPINWTFVVFWGLIVVGLGVLIGWIRGGKI